MLSSVRGDIMRFTYKLESEMELVARHVKVLKIVAKNQPIGIIKLSQMINEPEHKVRYSLRILEQEGLIDPSPGGAKATRKVKREMKNVRDVLDKIIEQAKAIQKEIDELIETKK